MSALHHLHLEVNNPCRLVKRSCMIVSEKASLVRINHAAVDSLAASIEKEGFGTTTVNWDDCGWHYIDKDGGPLTAQYTLVLDALNFCFWPEKGMEYDDLAVSLRNVLVQDANAFNAENLSTMNVDKLSSWFPKHTLPQVEERVDCLQELGQVLARDFDGLALNAVKASKNSAVQFVNLMLAHFPHFRDTAMYDGRLIHFYKRAQILTGDLWAAYGKPTDPQHPCCFSDIAELTMFADYRVPQILRVMNVLEYAPELALIIDNLEELPWGSRGEVEIRAQTVIAVELLQKALFKRGCPLMTLECDWLLWQKGEEMKDKILPHHRTFSIYY